MGENGTHCDSNRNSLGEWIDERIKLHWSLKYTQPQRGGIVMAVNFDEGTSPRGAIYKINGRNFFERIKDEWLEITGENWTHCHSVMNSLEGGRDEGWRGEGSSISLSPLDFITQFGCFTCGMGSFWSAAQWGLVLGMSYRRRSFFDPRRCHPERRAAKRNGVEGSL